MTVSEIMDFFLDHGITSAPVLDNFGNVAGMMTEWTLITLFFRVQAKHDAKDQLAFHLDSLETADLVEESTPASEVFKILLKSTTHRVLVLDNHKKIVGIISPKDVLRHLSGDGHRLTKLQRDLKIANEQLLTLSGKLHDTEDVMKRYHSYLENAPFLVHSVNEEGKIIFTNKRLNAALGYGDGELIGKTFVDLYTEEHVPRAKEGLEKLIQHGWSQPVLTMMKMKDGTGTRVETSSSALFTEKGKFVGTVTMSRRLGGDNMLKALHGLIDMNKPLDDQ